MKPCSTRTDVCCTCEDHVEDRTRCAVAEKRKLAEVGMALDNLLKVTTFLRIAWPRPKETT